MIKKKLWLFVLLIVSTSAWAQLPVPGPEHVNNRRSMLITAQYNLWPSYTFNDEYQWETSGGGASFLYSYTRDINVGGGVCYHSMTSAALSGQRYDEFLNTDVKFDYFYELNVISIYLKGQYFWLNHRTAGLYSGLDLGFATGKAEPNYTSTHVGYLDDYKVSPLAVQFTILGCHFLQGQHLFCNFELGYGTRGSVCVGLGYRL